jgi:hypothetical protein
MLLLPQRQGQSSMGMDKLIGMAKDPMGEFQSESSGYS